MNDNIKYKHGKPGIGATGLRGSQGESGTGFYIYDFKNDNPDDVFITGNDIIEQNLLSLYNLSHKNISYSLDEKRLHPKYKSGDTFIIIEETDDNIEIISQITLNDNHVLCTYDYFKSSCDTNSYINPISYKYVIDNYIHHKLCITNSDSSNIYNELDKYGNAVINGTLLSDVTSAISIENNIDDMYHEHTQHNYIPIIYNTDTYYNIVNNGAHLNVYKCDVTKTNNTLVSLLTSNNTDSKQFNINTNYNGINICTNTSILNIDNLYIKNTNKGNIEAENILFNPYLLLDKNGFCYTLNINDYNANTQTLSSDITKFFKEIPDDISLYHTGYIHTMYNFDMNNSNVVLDYYRPNYIYDISTVNINVSVIRKDASGVYVRNWDIISDINNDFIKELLATQTTDVKLPDISNLLDKSVSVQEINLYREKTGIICVDNINTDVSCVIISDINPVVKDDLKIKWEYIKIFDENINDRLRIYKETEKGFNDNPDEDIELTADNQELLSEYIDTSYNSNIIYGNNIDKPIALTIYDTNANLYNIQEIIQYIQSPDGIRYYSKPTYAIYDTYSNTFNIITDEQTFVSSVTNTDNTSVNETMFEYEIKDDNHLYITDTNNIINDISILYNSATLSVSKNENVYLVDCTDIMRDTVKTDTIESYIDNENILSDILSGNIHQINNYAVPLLIEYTTVDDVSTKCQETYYFNTTGYIEKRTVPNVSLHIYNDMESLDKFNKVDNGITSNQFQFFMRVDIKNFDDTNWGIYEQYFNDIKLTFDIQENIADIRSKNNKIANQISNKTYNLNIHKLPIDTDIFNISLKDIIEKGTLLDNNLSFNMNIDDEKSFYLHFILSSISPIETDIHFAYTATNIKVITDRKTFNTPNTLYYASNHLFAKLLPIALTAEYDKTSEDNVITCTGLKQYGSDKKVTVSIYPNNAYTLKSRYLQDNIESIDVSVININDIYNALPENLYNQEWLAKDTDDVYYTYLMLQYSADKTYMMEDEEIFCYNNEKYLASKYNQINNNAGVFVQQNISKKVRDKNMISSISMWNTEYKTLYHKESDNPFTGHNNVYGNGYQYLDYNVDNNQYISDGIMSLSDILKIGEYPVFDNNIYTIDISDPDTYDNYTPDILYRTLVKKLGWIYPQYTTENNIQLVHIRNVCNAPNLYADITDSEEMSYNYMYTIYPRILYNDEKQENIILMLQKPDIGKNSIQFEVNESTKYLNVLN